MPINSSALKQKFSEQDLLVVTLRQLMKKAGVNEAELSRKTHIPQATVHKILSGKTEDPRGSTLKTFADFFGISVDDLLSGTVTPVGKSTSAAAQSVPIISWKECIEPIKFISELTPTNWEKWVVSEYFSKHAYALASKPSMAPRFPKDTILFIDSDMSPKDGDYVVVLYPNTDEATLRELSTDGPNKLLLPVNPNADHTKLEKNVKVLGVLCKSSYKF